jgi:hypothetical protein
MRTRLRSTLPCLGLVGLAACGADGPGPQLRGPASLFVENQSQYTLVELRTHTSTVYADAPNRLDAPLPIDGEVLWWETGTLHVTAMRERNRGGRLIALTTSRPITLTGERGYRLLVFDDSFRLTDDRFVPPGDGGVGDARRDAGSRADAGPADDAGPSADAGDAALDAGVIDGG